MQKLLLRLLCIFSAIKYFYKTCRMLLKFSYGIKITLVTISVVVTFFLFRWENFYYDWFYKTRRKCSSVISCNDKKNETVENKPNSIQRIVNYEPFCGPYHLDGASQTNYDLNFAFATNHSGCIISPVHDSECKNIYRHYYRVNAVEKCPNDSSFEFCKLTGPSSLANAKLDLKFSCDFKHCNELKEISVGVINGSTGILFWETYMASEISEKVIADHAVLSIKNGNPFMFLKCTQISSKFMLMQLLILPYIGSPFPMKTSENLGYININMIFIDSVSRAHFYRSMPKTIKFLQGLRVTEDTNVLDFEYFHSLKGRTYENLQALFSGEILDFKDQYDGDAVPPSRVKFERLLKRFKYLGYETIYQEDLCWEYDWGLIKDTGIYLKQLPKAERFAAFMNAIRNSCIDHLGLTHSSCEIFHNYGIIDHFNVPYGICHSGRFQHDFFLSYLKNAILSKNRGPLFSFLMTDVGHEGTGKRIRTLDDSMVDFLSSVQSQDETIHILLSDHGNSYGPFSVTSKGRFETFHPFLFMIIPPKIFKKIGEEGIRNLRANQKRLINSKDIHFTLLHLLDLVRKEKSQELKKPIIANLGLFHPISPERGCDDLNLLGGTLCYCEGWKTLLPASSVHYLIAEHVLAKINKKILSSQIRSQKSANVFQEAKICQQLVGKSIGNVWQKKKDDLLLTGLDIIVQDGNAFSAIVSLRIGNDHIFDLKINNINRLTSYGRYRLCADSSIPLTFCICSLKPSENKDSNLNSRSAMFGVKTTFRLIHDNCLYILERSYKAGVVFEASNACWNVSYTVKLNFKLNNMKLAKESHPTRIMPGSVRHLAVAIMDETVLHWSYDYSMALTWKEVKSNFS